MVSDGFYDKLRTRAGARGMGRFLEAIAAPHLGASDLEAEYRAMAADEEREREALEWIEANVDDALPDEDWSWLRDAERRGLVGDIRSGDRRRDTKD